MMSSDALIHELTADLQPVHRRRLSREAGLLVAVGAAELTLLLALGVMRPDMAQVIVSPYMLWKLGGLLVLAGAGCTLAIRSFSPLVRPRRGTLAVIGLGLAVMVSGLLVGPADGGDQSLLARLQPTHGILCACAIIVLSMPIMAVLGRLMRAAAPTRPEGSALAAGLAAGACGAFLFAFCCQVNDPLYVIVWYSVACSAVAGLSRWLLPRHFRL